MHKVLLRPRCLRLPLPRRYIINNNKPLALALIPGATIAMNLCIFPRFAYIQIGEGHVGMFQTNVHNVGNLHAMVLVTVVMYLLGMPRANRPQGGPTDRRSRGARKGPKRSPSAQPKMECTMMIADDQQQQDDQPEGAMLVGEDFQPRPVVNVDVREDLLATHFSRDKKTLFRVQVGLQDRTVWALIDTGASRNLISDRDYEALPRTTTLRPQGSLMVVVGINQEIPMLGWITVRFTINTRSAYHEFGDVKKLPIDMLFGGEFLRPHECQII